MNRSMALALAGSLTLLIPAGAAVAPPAPAPLDLVARAGNYELSAEHLAALIATGKLPGNTESAAILASFWVDYHLAAIAAARNDSLNSAKLADDAMWATIDAAIAQKYLETARRAVISFDTTGLGARYLTGDFLAAQHILIAFPEGTKGKTQAAQDSVRRKAASIRVKVTGTNFSEMARQYTDEPGGKENDGRLGVSPPGTWVAPFEAAVRALTPGEVTPALVRTQFGYHIIRRHKLPEVRDEYIDHLRVRDDVAEMTQILAKLKTDFSLEARPALVATARNVARDPDAWVEDKTVLATARDGDFTAGRLAKSILAYPRLAGNTLRQRLVSLPDTAVVRLVRDSIAGKQLVVAAARRANVTLGTTEMTSIRAMFRNFVIQTNKSLQIDAKSLGDPSRPVAERERLAVSRVVAAFEKLTATGGEDFVEMPVQYSAALRATYPWGVNRGGYNRVIARAGAIRAALDSARAQRAVKR